MRLGLIICLLLWAHQAQAGPWPRERGEGFLSFSTEYTDEDDSLFTALYAEYGLVRRITAGVDLGFSDEALYKSVLFARLPFSPDDLPLKVAVELGVGLYEDDAVLRPGLSIGRGFSLGRRSGWWTLEALAYYKPEDSDVDVSTDLTFGLNMSDRLKLILQLQNGNQPMDPDYLNLATSVVVETAPGLHLELGVKTGLADEGRHAIELGVWHHF